MKNCLNLGCGTDYRESKKEENWVNIDIDHNVKTDWCGDARSMPNDGDYLLGDDETCWGDNFDHIYSHHSLEHFPDLFTIVDEMARVSKNGATWEIIVPYCTWTRNLANPHHKIYFDENTFRFFDKGDNGIHKRREQDYSIETVGIEWGWNENCLPHNGYSMADAREREVAMVWDKDKYLNVVREITFHLICHK